MRRWIPALVAIVLSCGAPVWASGGSEQAVQTVRSGEITYLDGDVTVDGREAQIGQTVRRGATVQTGAASICEITLGGQNIIQIQEGTIAVLEPGGLAAGIRLESGSIAAVLNKVDAISRRGSSSRIRTPSAVAGVRGTVFFVKVEDANNTYVCACNGALGVAPASGEQVDLSSSRHNARRFSRDGRKASVAPAGLLYHDDKMMNAVAAKIGYTIPWGEGGYGSPETGAYGY